MLNIPELEKRWLRYKIKSFLPYVITLSLICMLVCVYSFFDILNNKKIVEKKTTKSTPIYIKEKKREPLKQKSLTKVVTAPIQASLKESKEDKAKVKLSPSMNFIKILQTQNIEEEPHLIKQKIVEPPKKIKKEIKAKPIQKEKISTITITKQDAAKDIQNILHRFKEDRKPALSLFLAKKYYELGDYKKASNYALITNQLNKEIEDSWLIFAKALVKSGKKEKAIKVLQEYINNSNSTNAAMLLNDIKLGGFQ